MTAWTRTHLRPWVEFARELAPRKRIFGRRGLSATAVIGSGAILVAGTGTAFAYWSASGSGNATRSAAAGLNAIQTTATVAQGALLYPGGPAAPLTLNINNSGNNYALYVTAVTLDTNRSVTASGGAGTCSNPALTLSASGWAGVTVAPNSASGAVTIPSAVSMGVGADNGCQGATFTIPVTLTGHN